MHKVRRKWFFATIFVFGLFFEGADFSFAQDSILLPPTPKRAPPPQVDDAFERDLERKRTRRKSLEAPKKTPLEEAQEKKDSALKDEALRPRPRFMMMEVSYLVPGISVSGDLKKYYGDITSHFQTAFRHGGREKDGRIGIWYGLRLAPFSGVGTYKGIPGTFGFLYFGPMLGIGSLARGQGDLGQKTEDPSGRPKEPSLSVGGWLVSFGVAMQSRKGRVDPSKENEIDREFDTKVGIDAPGIWLELRYLHVFYGALGLNGIFGVQTGKNKVIAYTGIGTAGWY
jgi:hypothetical protein